MGQAWTLSSTGNTNLMNLGSSRPRLKDGDVFVLNMCGTRWIVGRVVRVGLPPPKGKEMLVYFYRLSVAHPDAIRTPIPLDLLLPPTLLLSASLWYEGLARRLFNAPLLREERLSRHMFKTVFDPPWVDEEGNATDPPEPGDVPGEYSYPFVGAVDFHLSKALGIAPFEHPPPKRDDHGVPESLGLPTGRTPEVWLFIKPNDVLDFGEFDDECGDALRAAKLARSSGRGCDLESGVRDAVYRGKDPDAIIGVIRDTMRRLGGIPPGAVAMVWRGPGHTAWEKVRLDTK